MATTPSYRQQAWRELLAGAGAHIAATAGLTLALLVLIAFPSLVVRLPGRIYLPIHTILEMLAIVVGFAIFAVQWNASKARELREPRALFVGAAFLAVALIDTMHTLAFPGMPGMFEPSSTESGIVFWLCGRLWFALAMLVAVVLPAKPASVLGRRGVLLALNLTVAAIPLLVDPLLPHGLLFDEPTGLTTLKIALELTIAALNLATIPLYLRAFRRDGDRTFVLIAMALLLSAMASLTLTLYSHALDSFNLLGHLFKAVGHYLVFDALFVAALLRPYRKLDTTARELAASNAELTRLRDHIQGELATTISQLAEKSKSERDARERAEAAIDRLRAIESITQSALAQPDLDKLLDELLWRVCQALSADTATILLLDADRRALSVRASRGLDGDESLRIRIGEGIAGRIAERLEPLIVEDISTVPVVSPVLKARVRSLVGVPLLVEGRCIGVLHAGTGAQRAFTQDDLGILQLTADRVASAIERARIAAELEVVVTSLPDALIVYDSEGRIVRANTAAANLFQYSPEQKRQTAIDRLAGLDLSQADGTRLMPEDSPMLRALRGETVLGATLVLRRAGRTTWLSASSAPIRDRGGALLGAVLTLTDITALHELQQQREDLLHTVSHDLRTPLTTIQLQAQLIQRAVSRGMGAQPTLRATDAIVTAAQRMNSIIQDLVDSARLAAGQLQLDKQPLDLLAFTLEMLTRTAGVVDASRIRIEIPEGLPKVYADPSRLERILMNLLTNALKYSAPGTTVTLSARVEADALLVSVIDHGEGVPPADLNRLFERYFRASGARKKEGVGLGLFITRKLVEAHGGRIWAESTPGVGSTFSFRLPNREEGSVAA